MIHQIICWFRCAAQQNWRKKLAQREHWCEH